MDHTYMTDSAQQTEAVGRAFAEQLRSRGETSALIALRGGLGVGKTAFARGFADAFGIHHVKSPTYTIVNEYHGEQAVIFHFDMYRLEDEDDLYSIGFDDYLRRQAYLLIEWSENIEAALPRERYVVSIERLSHEQPDARRISIKKEADI